MEGGKDPFNRRTYPWGKEDAELIVFFRHLGQLRKQYPALRLGEIHFLQAAEGSLRFQRSWQTQTIECYVNLQEGQFTIKEV